LQKGTFGEALAKIMFIQNGFEVYTLEWDDRGVDFVVRRKSNSDAPMPMYNVQVKTITFRPAKGKTESNPSIYVNDEDGPLKSRDFLNKEFLFVSVRLIHDKAPKIYLARGSDWQGVYDAKTEKRELVETCLNYNPEKEKPDGSKSRAYFEYKYGNTWESKLKNYEFNEYVNSI
jgi:hypothetical protein